ncbi:hypothetical protein [Pseudomonas sp. S11A4]|uniref:hypothetical protein n=1 Tax=Pseudomonas sp. S11A4 TaxID=1476791 RepID=UPI00215CEFB4|nr:hypothetical protein [Pseudomonas sp. S11A4]MCR8933390.1 hypothetical protein [Pseudomonas sp. S11A4]
MMAPNGNVLSSGLFFSALRHTALRTLLKGFQVSAAHVEVQSGRVCGGVMKMRMPEWRAGMGIRQHVNVEVLPVLALAPFQSGDGLLRPDVLPVDQINHPVDAEKILVLVNPDANVLTCGPQTLTVLFQPLDQRLGSGIVVFEPLKLQGCVIQRSDFLFKFFDNVVRVDFFPAPPLGRY